MKKPALSILLLLFSITFALSTANADSLTNVTSSGGFNDTASWPGGCTQGLSSISATSTNGITVTATDAGNVSEDTQNPPGCSYGGWNGNFAPGENLVYSGAEFTGNNHGTGPITLDFSSPVSGVGTQVQDAIYGSFVAEISVYDENNLLGTFTEDGDSNGDADNSAIFLGIIDSTGADITSAVVNLVGSNGAAGDFAMNQVSLVETPEPSSILLFGVGLLGLIGMGLRQKHLSTHPSA